MVKNKIKKTVDFKIHNVIIDRQLNCKRNFSSAKQIYLFFLSFNFCYNRDGHKNHISILTLYTYPLYSLIAQEPL